MTNTTCEDPACGLPRDHVTPHQLRPGVCRHGGLRRKCETCDLGQEVDDLRAQLAEQEANHKAMLEAVGEEATRQLADKEEKYKRIADDYAKALEREASHREEIATLNRRVMEQTQGLMDRAADLASAREEIATERAAREKAEKEWDYFDRRATAAEQRVRELEDAVISWREAQAVNFLGEAGERDHPEAILAERGKPMSQAWRCCAKVKTGKNKGQRCSIPSSRFGHFCRVHRTIAEYQDTLSEQPEPGR